MSSPGDLSTFGGRRAARPTGRSRARPVGARIAGRPRGAPRAPGRRGERTRHSASSSGSACRRRSAAPALRCASREVVRQWLLPAVYERLRTGRGEFLAELAPACPVFVRFGGIDYDHDDDAIEKLDDFIRHAQRILTIVRRQPAASVARRQGHATCTRCSAPRGTRG